MEETLATSGKHKLAREISENWADLCLVYYPLPGYSNNVKTCILLYNINRVYIVEIAEVRNNWGGTGKNTICYTYINENEYNEFVEKINEVKSFEDFDRLMSYVKQKIDEVDREINKHFDQLIEVFREYIAKKNKLSVISDQQKLKEIIDQCLDQYVEE